MIANVSSDGGASMFGNDAFGRPPLGLVIQIERSYSVVWVFSFLLQITG
jgi:hypothetical protein